jgi:plasmid maintenance system antidote protein VapI
MTEKEMMSLPTYDPSNLLDALIAHLRLKNDRALASQLDVTPPQISKFRNKKSPLTPGLLIAIHEVSGLDIKFIRSLAGITASKVEFKRAA